MQAGAAGIIVSNHGARQLDYVPATINALEEVCAFAVVCIYFLLQGDQCYRFHSDCIIENV